jgi:hypothetical protein
MTMPHKRRPALLGTGRFGMHSLTINAQGVTLQVTRLLTRSSGFLTLLQSDGLARAMGRTESERTPCAP